MHQNTLFALLLDRRFGDAGFVDPPPDHFDRLFDGALTAVDKGLFGELQPEIHIVGNGQNGIPVDAADSFARLFLVGNVAQAKNNSVALDGKPGLADPWLAAPQFAANLRSDRFERSGDDIWDFHLE